MADEEDTDYATLILIFRERLIEKMIRLRGEIHASEAVAAALAIGEKRGIRTISATVHVFLS